MTTDTANDCSRLVGLIAQATKLLPRGRGAIPRAIGSIFEKVGAECYVVTRHGIKLVIAWRALDFFTTMAKNRWAFDYWVLDTCASLMPDKGVFYDVGANVGYLSLEMTRLKPACKLVASFEPQQDLVQALLKSSALNQISNIVVFEACVGEVSGTASFARERHSIHGHVDYVGSGKPSGVCAEKISLLALDDLVSNSVISPPDVIKIDVEGYEYQVLRGACALIAKYQPHIVFELSETTPRFGNSPRAYFDLLSSLGDYAYEIAVGSYRDAVHINDVDEFHEKFMRRPYQANILARARSRLGGQ